MKVPFVDLMRQYESCRGELDRAVAQVMAGGAYILGPAVEAFEEAFAAYCGTRYAVGVNTGTSALELGMAALGIGPGDEVITPVNSFIASSASISAVGATPVWVDIDPDTHNLDPVAVAAAVTPRTVAIMPVHLYGQPADMDAINAVARQHNLAVIEDACQAHGARYRGTRTGALGTFAAFSFYPSKNLGAMGDAGMVVTDDAALADSVRVMRNYGQSSKNRHVVRARNCRLDSMQAALLQVKLGRLDDWNTHRRQIATQYDAALANLPIVMPKVIDACEHVYHLYVVEVDAPSRVAAALGECGIDTGRHYPVPICLQPAYESCGISAGAFPVAEGKADRVLSLPLFPMMTDAEIDHVTASLSAAF